MSRKRIYANEPVNLDLWIKNTGERDGDEVIQVYIRKLKDKEGPLKTLRAFKRVHVKSGEKKQISIHLPNDSFEFFDPESNVMRVMAGEYEVLYGTSSERKDLKKIKVRIQ